MGVMLPLPPHPSCNRSNLLTFFFQQSLFWWKMTDHLQQALYRLTLVFRRRIQSAECRSPVTLFELLSSCNMRQIVVIYSLWLEGLFCYGQAGHLICDFHHHAHPTCSYFLNQMNKPRHTPLDRCMIKVLTFSATSLLPL